MTTTRVREAARARSPERQASTARTRKGGGSAAVGVVNRIQRDVGNRGVYRLLRSAPIQPKLTVGPADDEYEREADRVADDVMRMPAAPPAGMRAPLIVQRTCAACDAAEQEGAPRAAIHRKCAACEQDEKKGENEPPLRAARADPATPAITENVAAYVRSRPGYGHPLDPAIRRDMETRLGHDFGHVRVHDDAAAAVSARAINARAYTVGDDIVFAAGQFAPTATAGKRLLAHELVHVLQQSGPRDPAVVQRACLPAAKCPRPDEKGSGTAGEFGRDVAAEEAPGRQQLKAKLPPKKPKSGTHGGRAEHLTALAREHVPGDLKLIHGIFVDEAISKRVGARIISCKGWVSQNLPENTPVPEFEGASHRCVFVSREYEAEAADYRRGSSALGGRSREDWLVNMKTILTHEATHERFLGTAFPFQQSGVCSRDVLKGELSEMAAKISEFPHVVKKPDRLTQWFKHQATTHGESLPGTIRAIRCSCECPDADALIRAGFDLASASWSEELKAEFHAHMKRGSGEEHGVYWPYELPPRTGTVGRHELSLLGGAALSLSDKQAVAMLSYRFVLKQWASGRLRLTGGVQANLAGALVGAPRELGAAVVGVQYLSAPTATETMFGGLTGRIETGVGVGDFRLTPRGGDAASVRRGDYIMQIGAGVQFFIPGLTRLQPVSFEATYRLAEPIGPEAERIHAVGLQVSLPL